MHRTVPKLRLGLPTTSVDDCTCLYPEPAEWNTRDAGYIVRAASTCCVERICATVKSEQAIRLTASRGVYNIWFRSLKTRVAEDDNVLYGQDLLSSFGSTQFAQHPWCVEGKRQRRTLSHGAEEEKD